MMKIMIIPMCTGESRGRDFVRPKVLYVACQEGADDSDEQDRTPAEFIMDKTEL